MKNLILLILITTFSLSSFGQDQIYNNIRESKSALIDFNEEREIEKLYKGTSSLAVLEEIITDPNINECATKVISKIKSKLSLKTNDDVRLAILGLRLNDSIDDIAVGLLLKANILDQEILSTPITLNNLSNNDELKAMRIFKENVNNIKDKQSCVEESYRDLVDALTKESSQYKKALKHINKLAFKNSIINESEYKILEKLRIGRVFEWPLTLASYHKSLKDLDANFSQREKESSILITKRTQGKNHVKKSMRQELFEKYKSGQIQLLANMAKSLKERLASNEIAINITYSDQRVEVISLTPMEKFRFILKLLRRDLASLNNNPSVLGNIATYTDIITASYETGFVSSNELEQLASLEEIWNPKRTLKEKVIKWGERFGGLATVLLPPPYGYVSMMAIMLIDQQFSSAPVINSDINIF